MDLSYVKKLIKLLSDSEVDEIEIEEEGKKIRVVKHSNNSIPVPPGISAYQIPVFPQPSQVPSPPPPVESTAEPTAKPATAPKSNLHEIKSPIVGTFYKAPAPDAAPFVEVGSDVQPGTVLCIVEAMKLMNEIESDVAGKIAKVAVENGQAIEYGQTLFYVEPH
jgi:acetyl-CoA carboxylase biotin carboxyl carrier protein